MTGVQSSEVTCIHLQRHLQRSPGPQHCLDPHVLQCWNTCLAAFLLKHQFFAENLFQDVQVAWPVITAFKEKKTNQKCKQKTNQPNNFHLFLKIPDCNWQSSTASPLIIPESHQVLGIGIWDALMSYIICFTGNFLHSTSSHTQCSHGAPQQTGFS